MLYDYSKLIGRIAEKGKTKEEAAKLGAHITPQSFFEKLANKTRFNQNQIIGLCTFLDIPINEIGDYFFSWIS